MPALGVATVYRGVKSLLESGWLRSVKLPDEPDRYEVADKAHHHHFHCDDCGRVFEVDDCPKDLKRLAPRGFRVARHEVLLYGCCAECSE